MWYGKWVVNEIAGRQNKTKPLPRGAGRYLESVLSCRREVRASRISLERKQAGHLRLFRDLRGWRFTNGAFPELAEIACAFALATFSLPVRRSFDISMFAAQGHDRCVIHRGLRGPRMLLEARTGTAILQWFGLRIAKSLDYLLCSALSQPPARVVFAARATIVDFFLDKGLTLPYGAPEWLVAGTKSCPARRTISAATATK